MLLFGKNILNPLIFGFQLSVQTHTLICAAVANLHTLPRSDKKNYVFYAPMW